MAINQTLSVKVALVIVFILFKHLLFAQSELQNKNPESETYRLKKYNLSDYSMNFQNRYFEEQLYFKSSFPSLVNNSSPFFYQKNTTLSNFSFSINKFEATMPGLGSVTHYTSLIRWNAGKKTNFEFGAGLANQNTVFDPFVANYQFSFKAAAEYSFNHRLSTYLYGQYVTQPINKHDNYFDPLIYNNPFFIQSEIGAGVKAGFKKTNVDFKINSIYDKTSGGMTPVNSKIQIEF